MKLLTCLDLAPPWRIPLPRRRPNNHKILRAAPCPKVIPAQISSIYTAR